VLAAASMLLMRPPFPGAARLVLVVAWVLVVVGRLGHAQPFAAAAAYTGPADFPN